MGRGGDWLLDLGSLLPWCVTWVGGVGWGRGLGILPMCIWPWPWWACGVWCVVWVLGLVCACGGAGAGCGWCVVCGVGGWALCDMGMWVYVVSVMWSVWVGGGGGWGGGGGGGDGALVVGCWDGVVVWMCMCVLLVVGEHGGSGVALG